MKKKESEINQVSIEKRSVRETTKAKSTNQQKLNKVANNSKSIKKQVTKTKLTKEKVEDILEDSLKENQPDKSPDNEEQQNNKKSKNKKQIKSSPINKQKAEKVLDHIDKMLLMETQPQTSKSARINNQTILDIDDEDDEDESDFEEVEMEKGEEHLAELLKRDKPLEVNIENNKKSKKKVDLQAKMERMFKAAQKQLRIMTIKTHLVSWLTHGLYLNSICLDLEVASFVLSVQDKFTTKNKFQLVNFNKKILVNEFLLKINKNLQINSSSDEFNKSLLINKSNLIQAISELKCENFLQFILITLVILRNQSIKCRLCVCFDVISLNDNNKSSKRPSSSSKVNKKILSSDYDDDDDNEDEEEQVKTTKKSKSEEKPKIIKRKSNTKMNEKQSKKVKTSISSKLSQIESSSSSDEEESDTKAADENSNLTQSSDNRYYWLEVYLEEEKTWISVDPFDSKLTNCESSYFEKRFGKQILYVCAFDGDFKVKDVTKRYANDWEVSTRLNRISHLEEKKLWYEKMLIKHQTLDAALDMEEELQLKELRLKKGLPQTVSDYKDHPLYVLKRHLLKFQSIYPVNATPVGDFRKENVYSRDNMVTLHSRQTWLKFARVVKPYEKAYKVVKGRLKQSEYKQGLRENPDLDLFGYWQTKMFEPPFAENGRIPRNEFGNVELFQPCMLPIGCVHIKGCPNLNRCCRKLNLDCVAAVVGFDAHGGFSHAVMDGWVVCTEHKDAIMAAYEQQEIEANKRLIEKNEERILNNWKKLIKGVLIREKLKLKYNNKITTNKHDCLDKDDEIALKPTTSKASNNKIVSSDDEKDHLETESTKIIKVKASKSKPLAKNNNKKAKPKRKNNKYDEQDDEDEASSQSEYEEVTKKKRAPPKKPITRNSKKTEPNDASKKEIISSNKCSPVKKINKNNNNDDDDDLNLSNDDEN